MKTCELPGCRRPLTKNSPSPDFCSDNHQSAWLAQLLGIDQFPTPARVPVQLLSRWEDAPLPWLEGR